MLLKSSSVLYRHYHNNNEQRCDSTDNNILKYLHNFIVIYDAVVAVVRVVSPHEITLHYITE